MGIPGDRDVDMKRLGAAVAPAGSTWRGFGPSRTPNWCATSAYGAGTNSPRRVVDERQHLGSVRYLVDPRHQGHRMGHGWAGSALNTSWAATARPIAPIEAHIAGDLDPREERAGSVGVAAAPNGQVGRPEDAGLAPTDVHAPTRISVGTALPPGHGHAASRPMSTPELALLAQRCSRRSPAWFRRTRTCWGWSTPIYDGIRRRRGRSAPWALPTG